MAFTETTITYNYTNWDSEVSHETFVIDFLITHNRFYDTIKQE